MMRTCVLVVALTAAVGCTSDNQAYTAQAVAGAAVQGGAWFEQSGCTACHSVAVYNILNVAAPGPDLSTAVEDVPRRFGVTLDEFLRAPRGTMAMVLSGRIPMNDEQRTLAIERLEQAYRKHQESTGLMRPTTSH